MFNKFLSVEIENLLVLAANLDIQCALLNDSLKLGNSFDTKTISLMHYETLGVLENSYFLQILEFELIFCVLRGPIYLYF